MSDIKQNEIIEGNKLILVFMGYKESFTDSMGDPSDRARYVGEASWTTPEMCGYNNSWNCLMPVAAEITAINIPSNSQGVVHMAGIFSALTRINILEVWEDCVQFIKWYNQNK